MSNLNIELLTDEENNSNKKSEGVTHWQLPNVIDLCKNLLLYQRLNRNQKGCQHNTLKELLVDNTPKEKNKIRGDSA